MKRPVFCAPLCAVLCACSFLPGARHDNATEPNRQSFDANREAILVFGLADSKARVQLEAGDIKDSLYTADWSTLKPIFYGGADQGFVLVKVPADRPIAITSISTETRWHEFWAGGPFQTCRGQKVAVFQVPKGKVLYYSDFDFRLQGNSLLFTTVNHFADAKRYVDSNYPQLAGRLQPATFESLTRADDCQKNRPATGPLSTAER